MITKQKFPARRNLSEHERSTLTNALRVAAERYKEHADYLRKIAVTRTPNERIALQFERQREEARGRVIGEIADRAVRLYEKHDVRIERLTVLLDVLTCHSKVQPLRLDDLLAADDYNFLHDIGGINRHLDRDAYRLGDGFLPRFSAI